MIEVGQKVRVTSPGWASSETWEVYGTDPEKGAVHLHQPGDGETRLTVYETDVEPVEESVTKYDRIIERLMSEEMLRRPEVSDINARLVAAGLDGNGNFGSTGAALNAVNDVLEATGLVADSLAIQYYLSQPSGHRTLPITSRDGQTPYENVLVFQWYVHDTSGRTEVVAYVS